MIQVSGPGPLPIPLLKRHRPILRSLFFLDSDTDLRKSGVPMTSFQSSLGVMGSVSSRRMMGSGSGSSGISLLPLKALHNFPADAHGSSTFPSFASSPTWEGDKILIVSLVVKLAPIGKTWYHKSGIREIYKYLRGPGQQCNYDSASSILVQKKRMHMSL